MIDEGKPREKRRDAPLSVKLEVALAQLEDALRALGQIPADIERVVWNLDHWPALELRPHDPETGHHIPHQHDPKALKWLIFETHKAKTTGRRGESKLSLRDGDQGKIAKVDRIRKARAALAEAETRTGEREADRRAGRPKAKIPSRPKAPRKKQHRATGYVRRGV